MNFWQNIKPLFLPDIGTFFNQDIDEAKQLITRLHQSGIAVIKGEILHSPDICLPTEVNEQYFGKDSKQMIAENYRQLIERKVVSIEQYQEIFKYAQSLGLDVVVSVYDFEGANFAKEIGCIAIKVATSNITHQPLINHIAQLGIPMIIDSGNSTLEEILRAVQWAKEAGNSDILVEHSPPAPPNDISLHNLNFMKTIANATGLEVGLSDHHASEEMLYAAVALGAKVVEKGVCSDNLGDEQDSAHAIKISDIERTAQKLNNIASALGNGHRELPRRGRQIPARMGLVAKNDIAKGEKLTLLNTRFAFPALGVGTEHWQEVENSLVTCDIKADSPISWHNIERT